MNRNIVILNLFIEDEQKDTLLFIRRLETRITDFDFNNKSVLLNSITIMDGYGNIYPTKDSVFNYQFILKNLKSDDPKPFKWNITCNEFYIQNSAANIKLHNNKLFHIDKLSLKTTDIFLDSIHQKVNLSSCSAYLNGNHFLNNLSADIEKNRDTLIVKTLNLLTPNSHVNLKTTSVLLNTNDFAYNTNVVSLKLVLNELSDFLPRFDNIDNSISLSGNIKGNKTSINGESISLHTGSKSTLLCDFNILNFQHIENIKYSVDIKNLYTNKTDITQILKDFTKKDNIIIPNKLELLQDVTYSGVINGTYNDICNKGQISSYFGLMESDITLKRDYSNDKFWIEGNLKALPLYLDLLLNNKQMGEIAFDVSTKGYYSKHSGPNLDIVGNINHLYYNNQIVDSIGITGNISKKSFNGRISSFDPKIRFDFDGAINFDTLPSYDFLLNLYYANLYQLGLNKNDSTANLSFTVQADFVGNNIDNTSGEILISDIFYFTDTSYFATDSIKILSNPHEGGKEINIFSEFAEAHIEGNYKTITLLRSFSTFINYYLPTSGIAPSKTEHQNSISFDIIVNYPHPITKLISSDFKMSSGTRLFGDFNAQDMSINLSIESDQIEFQKKKLKNLMIRAYTRNNRLNVNLSSKELNYFKKSSLKNFNISTIIHSDSIQTNINWNNWLDLNYSGNINSLITLAKGPEKNNPYFKFDIFPSNINVLDTLWLLSKGYIKKDSAGYTFHNLKIDSGSSSWKLEGILSDNPEDSISLNIKNVNLSLLNILIKNDLLVFGGNLTGSVLIKDIKKQRKIDSDFNIKKLSLNNEIIGDTKLKTEWDKDSKSLMINGVAVNDSIETFTFKGSLSPQREEVNITTYFNKQPFKTVGPFLKPTFNNVSGTFDGKIFIYGNLKNPAWKGSLKATNAKLHVAPTNVNYYINDSVYFTDHSIQFKNIKLTDIDKNSGFLNGEITHSYFKEFFIDIDIETDKIMAVDLKNYQSPYYYGKIYGSGKVEINGEGNTVDINIAAKTENYSYIQIPLESKGDIQENDFIEFVNPYEVITNMANNNSKKNNQQSVKPKTVTNIRIDLDVTPDIEVQIIFDPQIGDMLRANGFANLTIESLGSDFNMYGDYTITKGDFMFTLQNVINKRLDILQGSSVSWTGHPLDADIDLDAVYKIRKASVYDLTLDEADKEKRVEVNTHLLMTGKLVNPNIKFAVDVPSATHAEAIDQLNSLPEEDLNKQVLSLLLVNRFTPLTSYQTGLGGNATEKLTATTASELLSNQLSSWMSQISNDFDLGFVYRPGDENTTQEYEVALSTNLFNDRILFNGNVGYSENQKNITNNPMTTDFQIEYKVNEKGNIRLRAFQKPNNDITYNQAPYTQGIGIFYTDDFDNFNELLQKIFRRETAIKPDEVEIKSESSQ